MFKMCLLTSKMIFSELFVLMNTIILLEDSLEKAFLISLILPLEAYVYNLLFDFRAKFDDWFL